MQWIESVADPKVLKDRSFEIPLTGRECPENGPVDLRAGAAGLCPPPKGSVARRKAIDGD
ncbi:MAG: hypothetical protein NC308_03375 [Clostridium sp.]|nr:hypothetical protein [Bacteroides sp.]MCM1197907.1 hypothetical protein [Clostridium sp.]